MRVSTKELMDRMGVGYVPGPYETCPWSYYDSDKSVTCSAEVRMNEHGNGAEAEIQMMYDDPPAGKLPMEQICAMKCAADRDMMWNVVDLKIKGEPFGADIYNWQEKSCSFFSAVVSAIIHEEIPDIDELIEEEFHKSERFSDQFGSGGGKSPKIRANQLLDIKKGGGGF